MRYADCGEKLYYCISKNFEARQDHFVCSTSRRKGKDACPTHFIRAVVLERGVLAHMRLIIACVSTYDLVGILPTFLLNKLSNRETA
ncbi:zinc ribbon domain-containing protein [Faecalicatena sp. BF-R-105]|nr:zinc ribbon domain-containing protein [Anaerotruncus sp. AF02-27]MCM0707247.1 zinc ribbon domain-containing protein [Faecalicatena sp. BF-R-105]